MFLNDFIRRRLAPLLRPWLRDEPELEFKLGFLRGGGKLKNINFNTSALNRLLDNSSGYRFKEVSIGELSVRFSCWSFPAISLHVSGLRISISLGEEEEGAGDVRPRKLRDTYLEDKKKYIADIDPEGSALHDAVEKISKVVIGSWRDGLTSTFLRYSQLQMDEIYILLLPPSSNDSVSCVLEIKEVGVVSESSQPMCFLGGLFGSSLGTSQVCCFDLEIRNFEIGFQRENCIKYVVSPINLSVSMKLENLQLSDTVFYLPALCFTFSPADLSFMSIFSSFAYKESIYSRSGRHLWRIASSRISLLIHTPKLSWYKVASSVKQWLCYVHTYENMLLMIGYPDRDMIRVSLNKMLSDKKYSRSFKHNWDLISKCEEDLPSEAIALARRTVRFRVSKSAQFGKQANPEFKGTLWRVFHLFSLIWAMTCHVLQQPFLGMLYLLRVVGHSRDQPKVRPQVQGISGDSFPESCFYLSVGIFSVSLSPEKEDLPNMHGPSSFRFSSDDLLLIRISSEAFLVEYFQNFPDQHVKLSFGSIKIASSDVEDDNDHANQRLREQLARKKKFLKPQDILWFEPAQRVEMASSHGCDGGMASLPLLESLIGQTWLDWEKIHNKLVRNDFEISRAPCILIESKCYLIDRTAKSPTSGFHQVVMVLGRLNFVLENSAILAIALLFGQMETLLRAGYVGGINEVQDQDSLAWNQSLSMADSHIERKSLSSIIETALSKIIPEKVIQVGGMIAGPRFRLSLRKENSVSRGGDSYLENNDDKFNLSFDVEDIEFVMSPNSEPKFTETSENYFQDEQINGLRVEEPDNFDVLSPTNKVYNCQVGVSLNAHLKFNGLKVYLCGDEVIRLSPITVQSSLLRKQCHSFGLTMVATSIAVKWLASGFTAVVFLDELSALVEVVSSLYDVASHIYTFFGSSGIQDSMRLDSAIASSESASMLVNSRRRACPASIQSFFGFKNIFELHSVDIALYYSRKSHNRDQGNRFTSQELAACAELDCGIYVSVQRMCGRSSFKDGIVELLIDLSVIRYILVRYPNPIEIAGRSEQLSLKSLLLSMKCLLEASLSHFKISLCIRIPEKSLTNEQQGSGADVSTSFMYENVIMVMETERQRDDSFNWLEVNICLGELCLAEATVKDMLVKKRKTNSLNASFSAGEQFRTICCKSQGGSISLETEAVLLLVKCLTLYSRLIEVLLQFMQPSDKSAVSQYVEPVEAPDDTPTQDSQQFMVTKLGHLQSCRISISEFCCAAVCRDEFGRLQELLFEANAQLHVEAANILKKVSLEISKISISSQILHETAEQKYRNIQIYNFPSTTCTDLSPSEVVGDSLPQTSRLKRKSILRNEPFVDDLREPTVLHSSPQNILKELCIVVAVEWPTEKDGRHAWYRNQLWVGDGSITGCDLSLSLTQLQMILSVVDSLSRVFSDEKVNVLVQRQQSRNQESEESFLDQVPDGAIVAIEDVLQHTYIAVEDEGSGYNLVGTIHYSLVGEKALFRVKHHSVGRWNRIQYISLISLYAKDASGEPLRLNGLSRSDYVSISASSDTAWALWSVTPYKPEAYNDFSDYGSDSFPIKNTFYLMNKKNDQSIAFIDGLLEFVSKPGNPFKWKIFHNLLPAGNDFPLTSCLVGNSGTITQDDSEVNDSGELKNSMNYRGITILIQKATLKIVHELLDTKETFPLLQGSVSSTEVIVQILNGKARLMTWLEIMLLHFDSQRNMWRELISPLEICLFFRYRFLTEGSKNVYSGVPGNFFARIKELNISLSELSLDMLLFMIGKLKLAGPFAVRSSVILANSCKVENKSGLTLLCEFFDGQHVKVAGGQTHIISLRHTELASHPPEASFFSIQLADKGSSTSVIRLSLSEAATVTWRTRIVSSEESKTSPGPFVVVEVSQKNEDGLLITVSPILKIHNETELSMELRFQRPQNQEAKAEYASLTLRAGDSIDDSVATFGGVGSSGGIKKAFMSLSIGNFLFSFRPTITDDLLNANVSSIEWSDELKGEKPVPLAGIFEKLSYQVRSAVGKSSKHSFGSACCAAKLEDGQIGNIHFLIQTIGKDVPVIQPDDSGYVSANNNLPIALLEQKEIFLLPTVHISNLLEMDIHVNLTDADPQTKVNYNNLYSQARVPSGSDVNLYANPANIFFTVNLTAFDSSSKPVSSSQWAKKLRKVKNNTSHLDIELDFENGKYFAFLRLSRGHRGILEATIYTSYTLRNDTENALCFTGGNHKPLSRDDIAKLGSRFPPGLGAYLPPNSRGSWLIKNPKVWVIMVEELEFEAILNMDALSSLTEIYLEAEENGVKKVMKLGISVKPSSNETVPSLVVSLNPRHVVINESDELILVRQCHLEDDMQGLITINSKQRTALKLQNGSRRKGEATVFENILRRHSKSLDDNISYIQFRLNDPNSCWSGPVCVASLGHFFLKFRASLLDTVSSSNCSMSDDPKFCKFAEVHVVEEDSTLVLHFHMPPNADLPYRIENCLQNTPVTYYQKESLHPEILGSGCSVDYVWDDLSLPHKLIVQLDGTHLLREINLDKVCAWKPIYRANKQRGMGLQFPVEMKSKEKSRNGLGELISTEVVKLGYEIYADGLTRVLRICEFPDRHKATMFYSTTKLRFGITYFALQLLESAKKGEEFGEALICKPIIIIRLEYIDMHSLITDHHKVNHITMKSLTVDEKREGAPFAAMLRKHQSNFNDDNRNILQVVLVLLSSSSSVTHIKYLSIILQPLDLNLDEETLMRIAPFWRASLSDSNTPSQKYYFDHFEIHPVKIVANFLPMDIYSSYTSTQEMLRTLLHSVIQVPTIKNKTVELNGVLVTHALITFRELSVKCAQHYSWYALRAIYLAKGSPLLPPAFASMFDDFSSSSLDVFFDPSSGMVNLPGLTMGTFKFISKCIHGKGFSGTKRYFGDLGKTLKSAGSNILFAAVTELSDSVLRGAETNGFNGMVRGFHRGILNLAMEPSLLGSAVMGGGPDRKITLDRSPGVDELYIEGYLQALLDALYKQEYLRVRVIDNQVMLKNLPPNSSLINEIIDRVKDFLISKGLLKGDGTTSGHSFRHIREENGWRFGPTVLTLLEHLFVSFAIRMLRKQVGKVVGRVKLKVSPEEKQDAVVLESSDVKQKVKFAWRSGVAKFILSGIVAYIDGRLCRSISNPIARRVVSGFLLSFLDKDETD